MTMQDTAMICSLCQAAADVRQSTAYRDKLGDEALKLARLAGFPKVQVRKGHFTSGEFLWRRLTTTADIPFLVDVVLPELRRRLSEYEGEVAA